MRITSVVIIAAVLAVLAGGGFWLYAHPGGVTLFSYSTAGTTAASTTSQTGAPAQAPAGTTQAATTTTNIPTHVTQATLHTNLGDITITFDSAAPNTVANFVKLASSGFYDGVKFHRVIKGFMDQAGDPLTKDDSQEVRWGTGGPGYTIADENQSAHNGVGVVSMANTGAPDSGGSQFFINAADNRFLDGKYNVFGTVTAGLDVALAINNTPTDQADRPLTPVVISSITLQ